ncbi:MAG: hypothetical protein JXN65_01030 [Clostridia bacterium]|nr:hypothetical protein [Clostridia bacterium]
MVDLPEYNPCKEESIKIKKTLEQTTGIENISVKYNGSFFITNLRKSYINLNKSKKNYSFSNKGFLQVRADWCFYKKTIKKVPKVKPYIIEDYELAGIIKSMYAQIDFRFVSYRLPKMINRELIDFIFKSIYSKSSSIKKKNIDMAMAEYNRLKKENKTSIYIIKAIIYMVYDYYNSVFI